MSGLRTLLFTRLGKGYVHSDYIVPFGLYRIGTIVSETKMYPDHGFTPLQRRSKLATGNQVQLIGQEELWISKE